MMNKQLTTAEIEFIIARVLQNAEDAIEESKDNSTDFMDGKKIAYYEVLDTIKNELSVRDVDTSQLGIDEILGNLI